MFANNNPWTKSQVAILLRLSAKNMPPRHIAERLNRTLAAVYNKLGDLNGRRVYKRNVQKGIQTINGRDTAETKKDAERLMKEIPVDTRTWSQVAMGEPLPGRSALEMQGN